MQPRFSVGESVIYHRGDAAEAVGLSRDIVATVKPVAVDYNGIPYSEPIYRIVSENLDATVGEQSLEKA